MKIVFLVISVLFSLCQSFAAIQTKTHTCIVSKAENTILIIDRKTGEERVFERCGIEHFAAQGSMGMLCCTYSNQVIVIDLRTAKEITKIPVGELPKAIALTSNRAYVANANSDTVSVINLSTLKVIENITVGSSPNQIFFHGGCLYVMTKHRIHFMNLLNRNNDHVFKVDQWSKMEVYKDRLCVFHHASKNLSVINLDTWQLEKTISLSHPVDDMIFSGETGYAFNTHGFISLIDLGSLILRKWKNVINYGIFELHAVIDGRGYAWDNVEGFVVFDFDKDEVVEKFTGPRSSSVDSSDTHIYLGTSKIKPLPFILFKHPFTGIEGSLEGDEEAAFLNFTQACEVRNYPQSQGFFDEALALGHPKAFALASYAFMHGFWGAIDNDQDKWWLQFHQGADQSFFRDLCSGQVYFWR